MGKKGLVGAIRGLLCASASLGAAGVGYLRNVANKADSDSDLRKTSLSPGIWPPMRETTTLQKEYDNALLFSAAHAFRTDTRLKYQQP
jgi:hypothetical protein